MAEKELGLFDKAGLFFQKKDGMTLPTTDSLISGQPEMDDDETAAMREASEYYQSLAGQNISRDDLLPRVAPENNPVVDIGNILAGDLMASVGITLDKEGLTHDLDTAKDFWSEHPVRAGTAVALNVLPGLAAITKGYRVSKFANLSDDIVRSTGLVDEGVDLAQMAPEAKKMLKQQAYQIQRTRELAQKVEGGSASTQEKALHMFNKNFGNSYVEQMSMAYSGEGAAGLSKMYSEKMQNVIKGADIGKLLDELPEKSIGTSIAKYFNDPAEINNIPKSAQPWAIALADRLRSNQKAMLSEGMLTEDTVDKVGDIWFSTLRKGSAITEEGISTSVLTIPGKGGKVKVLSVPRTTSPNLMDRSTSKQELSIILNRQEAAEALEAGNAEKAIGLLKAKKDAPEVVEMIANGDKTGAMGVLGQAGFIDTTPGALTVKGLVQQTLLFENFRYLRDIAMNPSYIKNASEFSALSKPVQARMRSLDQLPNSAIVRRMVGKKQGLNGAVAELGYVHEDVFKELTDAATGQPGVAQGLVSMIDLMTALHKTAKTAGNPFTQGQNIWGNYGFLAMRGWNPFNTRNHDLIWKTSYPAIRKLQKAARGGEGVPEITELDLGKLASQVGGKEINIAEEMASSELADVIEKQSLLASEGIGVIDRLARKADDSQVLIQAVAKGAQTFIKKAPGAAQAVDFYLAADGMVKMAYFLDLRTKGYSRLAASLEVARALPMYNTIGQTHKVLRKGALPWVSFPAEAMRIVKNNVMDYPLRSMMWFHGTDTLQALMYPALGESYKGMEMLKDGLPTYANKPATTLLTPLRDSNNDLRAATIDFLPWSSFLPQSASKDASMREIMPFGLGQPLPITDGLQMAMTGQDAFGKPIPTEPGSITEKISVMAKGTVGMIMPPLISKYFLSPGAPAWNYRIMQDAGLAKNPYTAKGGDPFYDMLMNNIGSLGAAKFYPSSAEQMMGNKNITERAIQDWRAKLTRNWNAFMRSGDYQTASEVFTDIKRSFMLEWKNPAVAQKKEMDFLLRHLRTLQKHPQLGSYSKERLIEIFTEQGDRLGGIRSKAYDDMKELISKEMAARKTGGKSSTDSSLDSSL